MNLKDFYASVEENYTEVIDRLRVESRVLKYVLKFADDKNFETLASSMKEKKYDEAFRAAHTLKGICLNLGFNSFYKVISEITEKLRKFDETERIENDESIGILMDTAAERYNMLIDGIASIER